MFEYGYVVVLGILILCIMDLRNHNKNVEKEWPDCDEYSNNQRSKFTINMYGYYFLFIALIGLIIKSVFNVL